MSCGGAKKWSCDYCTYENWPSATKCTLCRGRKSSQLIREENAGRQGNDIYLVSGLISVPEETQQQQQQQQIQQQQNHHHHLLHHQQHQRDQLQLNVANQDTNPKQQQRDPFKKWVCSACTYLNWPRTTKCVQCYTVRRCDRQSPPVLSSPPPPPSSAVVITPTGGVGGNGSVCATTPSGDAGSLSFQAAAAARSSPTSPSPDVNELRYSQNDRNRTMTLNCLQAQKWVCRACTYENWPKSLRCVICESARSRGRFGADFGSIRGQQQQHPEENLEDARRTIACGSKGIHNSPGGESLDPFITPSAGTSTAGGSNNYENEMRLKQLRKCMRDADWPWLKACLGVVDGDSGPVEAYLAAGGNPSRQLTQSEVNLLSRPSAFDVGHTLVHLAIRFQREDLLAILLTVAEGGPHAGLKRVPSHVSPDLAADIRRHITSCLRQRKGDFPCSFVTELVTFALPAEIDDLSTDVQEHLFDELLDRDVQKELEVESPIINWSLELTERLGSRLYALWNRTAGDCLLDSVLQATWGVFDRESTLRRALSDSLNEASSIFYPLWKEYEAMQARLLHFSLDESQWQQDWSLLLSLAGQPGASLEQLHIFAVSHILRRPIIVYGVKFVKSFRGEAIGYARFEGVYLPILWEQSFCWKTPIALGYTRGHFSALVPMQPDMDENLGAGANMNNGEDLQMVFLPLMTSDGKLLPIHFMPDSENGHEEQMLRHWLDCCVTEGGILVAQQKIQRRPLLVAQMVEEWLNYYRRLCHVQSPRIRSTAPLHNQGYASDGDSDDE